MGSRRSLGGAPARSRPPAARGCSLPATTADLRAAGRGLLAALRCPSAAPAAPCRPARSSLGARGLQVSRTGGTDLRNALEQVARAAIYPVPGLSCAFGHPSQQRFSAPLPAVPLPFCTGSAPSVGLAGALDRSGVAELGRGARMGRRSFGQSAKARAPIAPHHHPHHGTPHHQRRDAMAGRYRAQWAAAGARVAGYVCYYRPEPSRPKPEQEPAVSAKMNVHYESVPTGPRIDKGERR